MPKKEIEARIFRYNPATDKEPAFIPYTIPWREGMSAMDALDYVYQNLDSTLAYYDHAGCSLGICGKCTGKINGKPGLFCQTLVEGDVILEPLSKENILKDLVMGRKPTRKSSDKPMEPQSDASGDDMDSVTILARREIEALIAAPLIKAFQAEIGEEKTKAIVSAVVRDLAFESGKLLAAFSGGNQLKDLAKSLPLFAMGGALELDIIKKTDEEIIIHITRCKYAEMYRKHGLTELGLMLSCARDHDLIKGFNPDIRFERTQTIMEGAKFCDFCFKG